MKRYKALLISAICAIFLLGTVLAKDAYPEDWILYMKKAGKETFYLTFPRDPSFHILYDEGVNPSPVWQFEAKEKDSLYYLQVYPVDSFDAIEADIWSHILGKQKDFTFLKSQKVSREKGWKKFDGEYLFTEEERAMIAEVKIVVTNGNVYAFFNKHLADQKSLFSEFTSSFSLLG